MRFELYQDAAQEWRWRLVAGNNRIIADGGEGYTRMADVYRAIGNIVAGAQRIANAYPELAPARSRRKARKTSAEDNAAAEVGFAVAKLAELRPTR